MRAKGKHLVVAVLVLTAMTTRAAHAGVGVSSAVRAEAAAAPVVEARVVEAPVVEVCAVQEIELPAKARVVLMPMGREGWALTLSGRF